MGKQLILPVAGKGTRMGPRSQDADMPPKALIPLFTTYNPNGYYYTYLMNHLELAEDYYDEIILVVGNKKERIIEYVDRFYRGRQGSKPILYVEQDIEKYPGTGGAVMAATDKLKSDVNIIMPDDLYDDKHYAEMSKIKKNAVIAAEVPDPTLFGVFKVRKGKGGTNIITDIIEKPKDYLFKWQNKDGKFFANTGFYNFNLDMLEKNVPKIKKSERGEYEITDIIKNAIDDNEEFLAIPALRFYQLGTIDELFENIPRLKKGKKDVKYITGYNAPIGNLYGPNFKEIMVEMQKFLG